MQSDQSIQLFDDESLAESIILTTVDNDPLLVNFSSILRCVPYDEIRRYDWRIDCIRAVYQVTDESFPFLSSARPWRLNALHQHKVQTQLLLPYWFDGLQKLTSDTNLTKSVRSLVHYQTAVDFGKLHTILKRLSHIRELHAYLSENKTGINFSRQVCQALNQLRCLRTLTIDTDIGLRKSSSASCMLLNNLNYGHILMSETPGDTITATAFAYKSLEIRFAQDDFADKWTTFTQLCNSLSHLIIKNRMENSWELYRSAVTLPPNLITLSLGFRVAGATLLHCPQILLRRLSVSEISFRWLDLFEQCPYIHTLQLSRIRIQGAVVGLPFLRQLGLLSMRSFFYDHAIVRYMCRQRLQRISMYQLAENDQFFKWHVMSEYRDWIANPDFLVGAYVCVDLSCKRFASGYPTAPPYRKVNSKRRVMLLFSRALFEDNM